MTSTINDLTHRTIAGTSFETLTVIAGAVVIALLVALMVEKEVVRAVGRPWGRRSQQGLSAMVIPLGIAFLTVVTVRFAVDVLHYHWG